MSNTKVSSKMVAENCPTSSLSHPFLLQLQILLCHKKKVYPTECHSCVQYAGVCN